MHVNDLTKGHDIFLGSIFFRRSGYRARRTICKNSKNRRIKSPPSFVVTKKP